METQTGEELGIEWITLLDRYGGMAYTVDMNEQKLIKRTYRINGWQDKVVKKHEEHHGSESAVVRFAIAHLGVCKGVKCETMEDMTDKRKKELGITD